MGSDFPWSSPKDDFASQNIFQLELDGGLLAAGAAYYNDFKHVK